MSDCRPAYGCCLLLPTPPTGHQGRSIKQPRAHLQCGRRTHGKWVPNTHAAGEALWSLLRGVWESLIVVVFLDESDGKVWPGRHKGALGTQHHR